jgi:hypothetical protein
MRQVDVWLSSLLPAGRGPHLKVVAVDRRQEGEHGARAEEPAQPLGDSDEKPGQVELTDESIRDLAVEPKYARHPRPPSLALSPFNPDEGPRAVTGRCACNAPTRAPRVYLASLGARDDLLPGDGAEDEAVAARQEAFEHVRLPGPLPKYGLRRS